MTIEKVAVIGSGVMGSGIAAQIANAGFPVLLLDIVPDKAEDRSILAKTSIQKMLKTDPAPFMSKKCARLVTPGNLEDDMDKISDCDWIIEVVLEDINIKHKTYEKIIKHCKKGAIVSSNTSSIPLHKLTEPFGDEFAQNFLVTHFFNPPRYMRLLELVTSDKTDKKVAKEIEDFCDITLGKGVVHCHDTPGFIANRLGVFWLQCGVNEALNLGISVEVADAVMSRPVGIPKTGVFGLIDLVGIDLMPHLAESLLSNLPEKDYYRDIFEDHAFIHDMIKKGYTGRKGKGGFYRLDPESGKKRVKQALELDKKSFSEQQYKNAQRPKPKAVSQGKKGIRAVVECDDKAGRYAWEVLSKTLHYAASLVPEIARDIWSVDEAMRLGYNWKKGPFEMMDDLGPAWFADKMGKAGYDIPKLLKDVGDGSFYKIEDGKSYYFGVDGKYHEIKHPDGVLSLADIKIQSEPVLKNGSACVWDIGDGALCFEHRTKMNTFDDQIFILMNKTFDLIEDDKNDYSSLVIYNEGPHFSAGANLGLAMFAMNIALWQQVEELISAGQRTFMRMKYASFPVVAAPSGLALGGGCEVLLHSDHIQAHAETYTGLVEVGVGLIPSWGGCKEMILRNQEKEIAAHNAIWFSPNTSPMTAIRKTFEVIGTAQIAKSALQAKDIGYFRERDGVTMNRNLLLFDAKSKACELAKGYEAPIKREDIRLPGASAKVALDMAVKDMCLSGKATPYDKVVASHLSLVLSGGKNADWTEPMSEDDLLKLEIQEFVKLIKNEGTMNRIEHMLDTGKPLRN